ncbi:hypothetical protein [Marinibacterium sp. SX1]|uniref:hypothetical protein n=1 Tax=Marinibacterium sp. SX1 TaxID=3388424 RepID=UPI003D1763E1
MGSNLVERVKRLMAPWPEVRPDTFILWEPCSKSHGEIVPGYARYLRDLGFDVLVLMTPARLDEGLFARFDPTGIRHGGLSQRQIRRFVQRPEIRQAAGILVTTAGKLPDGPDGAVDLARVFGQTRPDRVLLVEHDARPRIDCGAWDPQTITLRTLDYKGARSVVVNPHDFGTVRHGPRNGDRTVFVMVGALRAKRGNAPLVYQTAERLIAGGRRNFEIRVIGKPGRDPVPDALRDHVVPLGRLPFDRLYDEVEAADFLLTSFQADNPDHDFYRTGGTSGAFQLAYGFAKPILLQEAFARLTRFNATNALVYGDDDGLMGAMARATDMDAGTYAALQAGMEATATAIYESSLVNLRGLACDG